MNRAELTADAFIERDFTPTTTYHFADGGYSVFENIVKDVQQKHDNGEYVWKYMRCTTDEEHRYVRDRFDMCAHYEEYYKLEYFEMSKDGIEWTKFAKRPVVYGERCVYAD